MTKVPRKPGAPMQLKFAVETLITNDKPEVQSAARLVICDHINNLDGLSEREKIEESLELWDMLGLRPVG